MGQAEALDAFTSVELKDILDTARERGTTLWEIIHDAVMADLAR